jgi:hypothetical protein
MSAIAPAALTLGLMLRYGREDDEIMRMCVGAWRQFRRLEQEGSWTPGYARGARLAYSACDAEWETCHFEVRQKLLERGL